MTSLNRVKNRNFQGSVERAPLVVMTIAAQSKQQKSRRVKAPNEIIRNDRNNFACRMVGPRNKRNPRHKVANRKENHPELNLPRIPLWVKPRTRSLPCGIQRAKQERPVRDRRKEHDRIVNTEEVEHRHRNRDCQREKQNPRERPVFLAHPRMPKDEQKLRQQEEDDSERNKFPGIFFERDNEIVEYFKAGVGADNHNERRLQKTAVPDTDTIFTDAKCHYGSNNRNERFRDMLIMT